MVSLDFLYYFIIFFTPDYFKSLTREATQKNLLTHEAGFKPLVDCFFMNIPGPDNDRISFPTLNGFEVWKRSDIIYIESANSQSTVFFAGEKTKIVICKSLMECEMKLKNKNFLRIHKKYLINILHLRYYYKGKGGVVEMSDKTQLDVSPQKKKALLDILK